MPESNAAAKRRQQKANRAAGIGDEMGRLIRVKEPPKKSLCTVCQIELVITKTNAELKIHAENKHGKTVEECFPGATAIQQELIAAVSKGGKGGGSGGKSSGDGMTKAEKKKKQAAAMDDLLSAGLSAGKKGKK